MVWLGTFEVTDAHECARPARLSSSVEADAQGGYWAIERLPLRRWTPCSR